MNRRQKIITAFVLLLFQLLPSMGQDKDFGIWSEVNIKHKLVKKLDAEISVAVRTFENTSRIEQTLGEAGLTYKFNDFVSVSGSFRLINTLEDDSEYHLRHRLFADIRGTLPAGDFAFSARLRLQKTTRTYVDNPEDELSRYFSRLRFKAAYDIPSFKINPYAFFESFIPVSSGRGFEISKFRFSAGAEINLPGKHSIEAGYIFEQDTRPDLINNRILSVSYNFRF